MLTGEDDQETFTFDRKECRDPNKPTSINPRNPKCRDPNKLTSVNPKNPDPKKINPRCLH